MKVFSVIVALLALLCVVSAGRLISEGDLGLPVLGDAPDFCHGLECPEYEGGKRRGHQKPRKCIRSLRCSVLFVNFNNTASRRNWFMS